jgi:hypothetical protein
MTVSHEGVLDTIIETGGKALSGWVFADTSPLRAVVGTSRPAVAGIVEDAATTANRTELAAGRVALATADGTVQTVGQVKRASADGTE